MASDPQTLFPGVTLRKSLASRVFLDHNHQTAIKVYKPPLIVKILYWLAFQAPFPYVRNESALLAAKARRRIAGLLTQFWYGRDIVSPVIAISGEGGSYAYVTRLIHGETPRDKRLAHAFMADLAGRFQQVGLPTWQINPRNPKAHENLIETSEGEYVIIDLESAVVSPMMPPGQWLDALRAGLLPVFDDLFLDRTRAYVSRREIQIRQSLGESGLAELWTAIDTYERHWQEWRRSELRLWARLYSAGAAVFRAGRRVLHALWLPSSIPSLLRTARQANDGELAQTLVEKGVVQWREEGRLDDETASQIETSIRAPEVLSVLRHLSAHTAMSIPLRFPLGSIARPAWTVSFRAKAEWRALVQRKHEEQTRAARSMHTGAVALISALPGIGAGAYLAAEPLRRNRPLLAVGLDQLLRKLPGHVYQRLHLVALTLWLATRRPQAAKTPGAPASLWPSRMTDWARASAESLRPHWRLTAVVLGVNAAALMAGGTYTVLAGSNGAFQEWGAITSMKVLESAAAGFAGVVVFRLFWRNPAAEADADAAAGSFFWLVSGLGLAWLAIDDYLQVHERLGDFIDDILEAPIPLLNATDDAIVLGYLLGAVLVVAAFRGEIMRAPAVAALLGIGGVFGVLMIAVDLFAPHGTLIAGAEQPAHVMAIAFLVLAYVVKHREVAEQTTPAALPARLLSRGEPAPAEIAYSDTRSQAAHSRVGAGR